MCVLCIFSTNLTLSIRIKDLHSMIRSKKPVVFPIECLQPKTIAPTAPQTESPRTATYPQRDGQAELNWVAGYILRWVLQTCKKSSPATWEVPVVDPWEADLNSCQCRAMVICGYEHSSVSRAAITVYNTMTGRLLEQKGMSSRCQIILCTRKQRFPR